MAQTTTVRRRGGWTAPKCECGGTLVTTSTSRPIRWRKCKKCGRTVKEVMRKAYGLWVYRASGNDIM